MDHVKAKATRILASHCCVCSTPLVDAKSVELGIGPVCRRRYLKEPQIETTREMVLRAVGALAVSGLPEELVDKVLERKKDARQACNVLVYWASARFNDKEFVLGCTPVIRLLGYTNLADRLESDRSEIRLVTTDDKTEVQIFCPRDDQFVRGIRRIKGARQIRHEASNRFKCWAIPAKRPRKLELVALLGVAFGGQRCFGDKGIFSIDTKTWAAFEAALPARAPRAQTPPPQTLPSAAAVTVAVHNGRFSMATPYDPDFVDAVKNIPGRRWDPVTKEWSVPASKADRARALLQKHYGVMP